MSVGTGKVSHQLVSPKFFNWHGPRQLRKVPDPLVRTRRARLSSLSSATPKVGVAGSQEPQVHHLFIRDSKPPAQGNCQPLG